MSTGPLKLAAAALLVVVAVLNLYAWFGPSCSWADSSSGSLGKSE